jgi:hypothetical protein
MGTLQEAAPTRHGRMPRRVCGRATAVAATRGVMLRVSHDVCAGAPVCRGRVFRREEQVPVAPQQRYMHLRMGTRVHRGGPASATAERETIHV